MAWLVSCSDDGYQVVEENSPTSGKLKVYCERGMQLHIKNQAYTFEKIYNRAKIELVYCNESEAVQALFNDSCKTIVMNRQLSSNEEEQFKKKNIFISAMFVGKSAVALISNKEAPDSSITIESLIAILSGDTAGRRFKTIIFESEKTSTALYCQDSLLQGKPLGKNCYAASDVNDLVSRINNNKNAIGVMDYIWISDSDDSLHKSFLSKIALLPVAAKGNETAYFPDQSNIQTNDYPLTRNMYMIRRGEDFSLAAGFITYVAGPDGQIIMLKSGLAPWRQPERLISVDMSPVK
jgi:phosphate transport system substrate-binding protein